MAIGSFSLIIPAAGSGNRMGRNYNKLFILLAEKPLLWHTLKAFDGCEGLKEIILAIRPEDEPDIQAMLEGEDFTVPIRKVIGGETRQESVYNALTAVEEHCDSVWIHDGARPFVNPKVLSELKEAVKTASNAVLGVPAKDTVKCVDGQGYVAETLDRSSLWMIQTPQVFNKIQLLDANLRALQGEFQGTDDASLMEWAGYPVAVIQGDYFNIKITTPEDLVLAEAILSYIQRS